MTSLLISEVSSTAARKNQPFIILTHTAGYDQKDAVNGLVTFRNVTEATETSAALEIRQKSSGMRFRPNWKVVIPRHQFAAEDWDLIVTILLDRIRAQAPDTVIRTALHPDG